jgi:hypothetical protein
MMKINDHSKAQPWLDKVRHDTKIKSKNCEHNSQLEVVQQKREKAHENDKNAKDLEHEPPVARYARVVL